MQRNIIQIKFQFKHTIKKITKWLRHTGGLVVKSDWPKYLLAWLWWESLQWGCDCVRRAGSADPPGRPCLWQVPVRDICRRSSDQPGHHTCAGYPGSPWWSVAWEPSWTGDCTTLSLQQPSVNSCLALNLLLNQCKLTTSTAFYNKQFLSLITLGENHVSLFNFILMSINLIRFHSISSVNIKYSHCTIEHREVSSWVWVGFFWLFFFGGGDILAGFFCCFIGIFSPYWPHSWSQSSCWD